MAQRREDISEEMEAEGVPGLDDSDPAVEGQIPPRDHPQGALEWGVTPREQAIDEPIGERATREKPDAAPAADGREEVGRTVAPDDGDRYFDEEKDEVAHESGDNTALSAEEQAMHETDSP